MSCLYVRAVGGFCTKSRSGAAEDQACRHDHDRQPRLFGAVFLSRRSSEADRVFTRALQSRGRQGKEQTRSARSQGSLPGRQFVEPDPLVKNGTVDIECGSTANTIARQQEVAYSVIFYAPQFKWISLKSSGLKTTDDLKGKTVAVTQGTNTSQFVAKLNTEKGLGMKILQGKDHAESFLLVETVRASAFMEDDILLAGLKANAGSPDNFAFLTDAFPSDPYGVMMSKGDVKFKQLVDDTLKEAMKSGLYDKLYTKWFESPIPPKNINLNFPQSEKLRELVKIPSDKANGQ